MPSYRRRHAPGGTYFVTVVTENRQPILDTPMARDLLRRAIADCARARPFVLEAMVLLPDHLHALWRLPHGDADYAGRWASIKARFSREWLLSGGAEQPRTASRLRHRRRGVWQRHFWEHHVRDEADFERHLHYIHYNPVKHGLSTCPHGYEYSTFHRAVKRNVYEPTWCCACGGRAPEPPSFAGMDILAME